MVGHNDFTELTPSYNPALWKRKDYKLTFNLDNIPEFEELKKLNEQMKNLANPLNP